MLCSAAGKEELTECEPAKLMIGASRLLVRWTVLMSACSRSLFEEDIAIWLACCGSDERARLMSAPCGRGEAPRFDMLHQRLQPVLLSVEARCERACRSVQETEEGERDAGRVGFRHAQWAPVILSVFTASVQTAAVTLVFVLLPPLKGCLDISWDTEK